MAHFMKKYTVIALTTAVIFSGCSQLSTQPQAESHVPELAQSLPKEPLNGESLFQILLAEIATNRGEYGAAAALYGEIGSNHNDIVAIERGVALNQSIGNNAKVQELTERWIQLRPTDTDALRAHSVSLIANGQVDIGMNTIDRWLNQDPQADVSLIIPGLQTLTSEEITQVKVGLELLQSKHPKSASLLYTRSRLEFVTNNPDTAMNLANQSLAITDNLQVKLFKFQLLQATKDIKSATVLIQNLDKQHPENRQVAIAYARFIYQYEPQNLTKLEILNNRFATESIITRTYARATFDQKDYDASQAVFQRLIEQGFADEAHYYLAQIDLINAMPEAAITHFEAVSQPPFLTSALADWASLARSEDKQRLENSLDNALQNQPTQAPMLWRIKVNYYQRIGEADLAWQALNSALVQFPDDIPLLYDQAMIAAVTNRLAIMEKNLIAILEQDPDNEDALNALGYAWVDANKNLPLAKTYIDKALATDPENPAYQDSKGWYLHKTGDNEGALIWLKKAYAQMENDEVAAHVAEVLWQLDRKEEALFFKAEVTRINPESIFIEKLNELFNQ